MDHSFIEGNRRWFIFLKERTLRLCEWLIAYIAIRFGPVPAGVRNGLELLMPVKSSSTLPNSVNETKVESIHGLLPAHTYESIRDLIIRGRFAAGYRVRESEMAQRFGVSRTPVREALARLLQEGYLAPVSTGRRTELIVAPLSAETVRELWGIIGALEGYAVEAVAELPDIRRQAVADDLKRHNLELRQAAAERPRNPDKLFELQTAFHVRFVYETAGPRLRTLYEGVRQHVQRYEWVYGTQAGAEYEPSTAEHQKIIEAIRVGDAAAAKTAVESHWKNAAKRTVAVIEEIPPQRSRRRSRLADH